MAVNKDKEKEESLSFFQRISEKSRVVLVDNVTFEEKRHFLLSPLNIVVFITFFAMIIVAGTYAVIAYTPLKQSIPGFPNEADVQKLQKQDLDNVKFIEDMEHKAQVGELYYKNLSLILSDELPIDPTVHDSVGQTDSVDYSNISFEKSEEDSLLRVKMDEKEKYTLSYQEKKTVHDDNMEGVFFFTPLNGTVSNKINVKEGHFGIDIVAPKDEAVKTTLDGTVIFTEWTPESGHVIQVQHTHNLVSVYKHNSFLLKKTGDHVNAGDPIAIIGNTGEHTTGEHLHFELWYNGAPIDPEAFINF